MTNATVPQSKFFKVYQGGLKDEQLVKQHLLDKGHIVTASTKEEDMFQDIDCYVDGIPVSIKSQRSAIKYGTIGFELSQHLTTHQECATSKSILANKELTLKDIKRLEATGGWTPSWFYTGKAEVYYIYTGEVLRKYLKSDIIEHINTKGYKRIRPLKVETKAYQGGKYRYCNAVSGYLDIRAVKNVACILESPY